MPIVNSSGEQISRQASALDDPHRQTRSRAINKEMCERLAMPTVVGGGLELTGFRIRSPVIAPQGIATPEELANADDLVYPTVGGAWPLCAAFCRD